MMYHYFGRILCCCILWRVAIHPATIRNSKIVVYIKPYENGGITIPFL